MLNETSYERPALEVQLFRLACIFMLIGLLMAPMVFAIFLGVILLALGGLLGISAALVWFFRTGIKEFY